MSEFKPCPLCASDHVVLVTYEEDTQCEIECMKCHCRSGRYSDIWSATTAWNTRDGVAP